MSNILVVEDSRTQAERLRLLLTREGFEVEVATTGLDGLAKAQRKHPQLVISDITMPEMDGYEFCRAMKSSNLTARVPIILLTARASPADIIKGLERVYTVRGQHAFASVNVSVGGGLNMSNCDGDPAKPAIDNLRSVGIATVWTRRSHSRRGAMAASRMTTRAAASQLASVSAQKPGPAEPAISASPRRTSVTPQPRPTAAKPSAMVAQERPREG